ncbi:hypothetical protein ACEUZ9_001054 [Paracoccus litorisediminis]|uniref:hypothetical protein n=1 Tax=Paracoccus litorisediminis TaxID=2006130 RepID=UPI00372F7404
MQDHLKTRLRDVRDGHIGQNTPEGRGIMMEALKDDPQIAIQAMANTYPKSDMVRLMKEASIGPGDIGQLLYSDPLERERFYAGERIRAENIGQPGFDKFGDPKNNPVRDPFAKGPEPKPARAFADIDAFDDQLKNEEPEDDMTNPMAQLDLRRGPRPR